MLNKTETSKYILRTLRRTRRPPISVDVFRPRCFRATRTMDGRRDAGKNFQWDQSDGTYSKRNCDGIRKKRVTRLVHTEAETPRPTFPSTFHGPSTDDRKVAGAFTTRGQVSVGWPSLSRGKIAIRCSKGGAKRGENDQILDNEKERGRRYGFVKTFVRTTKGASAYSAYTAYTAYESPLDRVDRINFFPISR